VTEVVRGIDLLDSTPRHLYLQRLLGMPAPAYLHIPVAENRDGQKLSKLTGAAAVDIREPRPVLLQALKALEQTVDDGLGACSIGEIWRSAISNWDPARLAGRRRVAWTPPHDAAG